MLAARPPLRERLRQRQQALQQRSAELRERLALHGAALEPAFAGAEALRDGWRWTRAHPWVPAAVALLLVLRRPRVLWRGAWLGWRAWRLWQRYGARWQAWAGWLAAWRAAGRAPDGRPPGFRP